MAYELKGKIKVIKDAETFGSGFTKREMVVIDSSNEKYPQEINLEFVQDKVSLLDALAVGQEVTVTFDIRGREYNGKYFNNLQAWKVVASDGAEYVPAEENLPPVGADEDDDVPFNQA